MPRPRKITAWLSWLDKPAPPPLVTRFHVWDGGDRKHVLVGMFVGPDLDHLANAGQLCFTHAEWNRLHHAFNRLGPVVHMGRRL